MNLPPRDARFAGENARPWWRLLRLGRAGADTRGALRRRTRLQSAKLFDAQGKFLCDAIVHDISDTGLRVALARNCGLPTRFGVHIDLTGEVMTTTVAWRRERVAGLRVHAREAPGPLRPSDLRALAGRYYAVRG